MVAGMVEGRNSPVRAGIVVTGTEVLTGRVTDVNGPWLAERLRRLGVDVGQVLVVGDRPEDLRSALAFVSAGHDLVVVTGGLGPTADDLTAEVVAQVQGRPPRLDEELRQRIAAVVERLSAGRGGAWDPEATDRGIRKQALVPEGATVLEPAGTAPGLVVPVAEGRSGPPVVVLPGPPWELRRTWPAALEVPEVRAVLEGAAEIRQRTLRLWGVPESELAATLRRVEPDLAGLEITTCLREGELEIVSRYPPAAEPAQERLVAAVRKDFAAQLFSADGATLDELLIAEFSELGWTVAVVESATGGAISARLSGAGPTPHFLGGLAVGSGVGGSGAPGSETADEATAREGRAGNQSIAAAAIPLELTAATGAVGEDLAREMAHGARSAFGADVGLGVTALDVSTTDSTGTGTGGSTGSSGTGGRVHLGVVTPDGARSRSLAVDGSPDVARPRILAAALHLLRQALRE
jgi:nicotinamide-nucleotide amidase